jgi:hypothetical protein
MSSQTIRGKAIFKKRFLKSDFQTKIKGPDFEKTPVSKFKHNKQDKQQYKAMREDKEIRELSYRVERTCWLLIFFAMLTQSMISFSLFLSQNINVHFFNFSFGLTFCSYLYKFSNI